MPSKYGQPCPTSNLLVVDDDPLIADLIAYKLRPLGYNVQTATDGDVGLELAKQIHPDLIMVDWMMPNMTGVEFCRKARHCELSSTPIILLTARTDQRDVEEGLQAGATAYLRKPFNPTELARTVGELLA